MTIKDFELNTDQNKVLSHKKGPLLVVAGAGTGKTRVIVEKINQLLDEGVKAESILALTFTEKAAAEMLDRVLERRTGYQSELPIMTFNAYGEALLREFSADAGLARNFQLIGDNAKLVFLRQRREHLKLDYFAPVSNPESQLPDIAKFFSLLKQKVITPQSYLKFTRNMPSSNEAEMIEKTKHLELAKAYGAYIKLCQSENVIDYDDQIYAVITMLKRRPNVRQILQKRYHTILVDEFQDTNPMQSQLIDLLVSEEQNLIVVGDDDQSIYGFRGADIDNILDFKDRYPRTKEITLRQNYRSDQNILDAAYSLIQNNNPERLEYKLKINKKLTAEFCRQAPEVQAFDSLDLELDWLSQTVAKLIKNGTDIGQIAILCRRNYTAELVSQKFSQDNIEHIVIGQSYNLYKTEIVRMIVEALKIVVDPSASTSLYHTLCGGLFGISPAALTQYSVAASKNYEDLETYLNAIETPTNIAGPLKMIQKWREQAATLSVGRLVYKMLEESGYKDNLYKQATRQSDQARAVIHLSRFFRRLKDFESIATQPTAIQFLESYPVLEAASENSEDSTLELANDKVNILTVHKAKGLEWQHVFIPDCTEQSFPMRPGFTGLKLPETLDDKADQGTQSHYAEERRLMYVAVTRAKEYLHLSYSTRHFSPTQRKPSRFLTEMFSALPEPEANDKLIVPTFDQGLSKSQDSIKLPTTMLRNNQLNLSVSQIITFLKCPQDFYYRFVLGVPTPQSHAANYGTAVHAAIQAYNQLKSGDKPIDLSEILQIFDSNWKTAGYLDKKHESKAKEQGRETLRNFYVRHENDHPPTKIEWPFHAKFDELGLTINGRLDAVFENDNGVEIRDYKTTSSVKTSDQAKSRASSSDQLTLYALVWRHLFDEIPAKLVLEFVDTTQEGSVSKTPRGLATMQSKLENMVATIHAGKFSPSGNDHNNCQHPDLKQS